MRRVFWLSVGAAAGYYAARKGQVMVDDARERGLVGNVTFVAATASKLASSASGAGVAMGEALGTRPRRFTDQHVPSTAPASDTEPSPSPAPSPTAPNSREVRP